MKRILFPETPLTTKKYQEVLSFIDRFSPQISQGNLFIATDTDSIFLMPGSLVEIAGTNYRIDSIIRPANLSFAVINKKYFFCVVGDAENIGAVLIPKEECSLDIELFGVYSNDKNRKAVAECYKDSNGWHYEYALTMYDRFPL